MSRPQTNNIVYFASESKQGKPKSEKSLSREKLQRILEALSKQAMKEKKPNLEELETILQDSLKQSENEEEGKISKEELDEVGSASITKLLQEKGYLKDDEKWLTKKGFLEIGGKILQDVMKDLNPAEFGFHETSYRGNGNIILDTTKKFEPGNDIRFLSVPHTLLNSIQRESKKNSKFNFPINIEPEDFEEYETLDEVSASIVYCIDLSSTMKYTIGKSGKSRISAAKKALWSLYILNKKFFPNDSIFVVGFGSMASKVDPFDIPFLKTFDANDNFLHYTNYQAALKLARKILKKNSALNKRIVLITDGQPSACYVENELQKQEIVSEKPYSNFYNPDQTVISKVKKEKNMILDSEPNRLVYLCYRYKKVDPKINKMTLLEAKKCKREGIDLDSIVVGDEKELLDYVKEFEKELKGKTYHIEKEDMDEVLVNDYLYNTRKVLSLHQSW